MPFLFPQSFIPPFARVGFPPPNQGGPSATVDLTAGSQKRDPQECVANQSKLTKKRRIARIKPEIIQLDDVKDYVDILKSVGHWKDHWVIQLITIRGEMHSTFSSPPQQGIIWILFFCNVNPPSLSPNSFTTCKEVQPPTLFSQSASSYFFNQHQIFERVLFLHPAAVSPGSCCFPSQVLSM